MTFISPSSSYRSQDSRQPSVTETSLHHQIQRLFFTLADPDTLQDLRSQVTDTDPSGLREMLTCYETERAIYRLQLAQARRRIDDARLQTQNTGNLGRRLRILYCLAAGHIPEALALMRSAPFNHCSSVTETDDIWTHPVLVQVQRFEHACQTGDRERARRLYRCLMRRPRVRAAPVLRIKVLLLRAQMAGADGDLDRSRRLWTRVYRIARQTGLVPIEWLCGLNLGRCCLYRGRMEDARRWLSRCVTLARRYRVRYYHGRTLVALGQHALYRGQSLRALRFLDIARCHAETIHDPGLRDRVHLLRTAAHIMGQAWEDGASELNQVSTTTLWGEFLRFLIAYRSLSLKRAARIQRNLQELVGVHPDGLYRLPALLAETALERMERARFPEQWATRAIRSVDQHPARGMVGHLLHLWYLTLHAMGLVQEWPREWLPWRPARAPEEHRAPRSNAPRKKDHDLGLVGSSPAIIAVRDRIRKYAPLPVPVLIVGETGTGKERVARALHRLGRVPRAPFVAVNCAALPENLFESEVFGTVRGVYTGAFQDRPGVLELAGAGTVLFDEIGELPPSVQAKLLRVVQQRAVRRLGDAAERPLRCRFLFATHRDLAGQVATGAFRADLFYRITVLTVHIPPLREHLEDLPELVHHLLRVHGRDLGISIEKVHPEIWDLLARRAWHGNVRELESAVIAAMVEAGDGGVLRARHFRPSTGFRFRSDAPQVRDANIAANWTAFHVPAGLPLAEARRRFDRWYIDHAIRAAGGQRKRAAEILGIARATLYQILKSGT